MKYIRITLIALFAFDPFMGFGSEETNAIAKVVNGIEIPVTIFRPEAGEGPFPVVFHVHGGGWNGGSETEVPPPTLGQDGKILCDRLGIIYVSLAYRCKDQDGTFALAMGDLHDSVAWFRERAGQFNADLSRIGFSGGSAGTPLSALMAQQVPECKTFFGGWGVYDLMDNEESLFPDAIARSRFGLSTKEQAYEASAIHHLRSPPPMTLLLHGGKDILTHASQSLKFGEQIKAKGGLAEVIIFPELNHNLLSPNNPVAYKKGVLAIAKLYQQGFDLKDIDFVGFEMDLDEQLRGYFPTDSIRSDQLLGNWAGSSETIRLFEDGQGEVIGKRGLTTEVTYRNLVDSFEVISNGVGRRFYLRQDERAIYEISQDERHGGKKEVYSKRK
jgi:acetyl esterase/lipase